MIETNNIDKIIADLGANYKNDREVLNDILEDMASIASNVSNRPKTDGELFPYIKKAVISEYNARGAEGMNSKNEGSQSNSFIDIEEKLRNDIIKNGKRRIK